MKNVLMKIIERMYHSVHFPLYRLALFFLKYNQQRRLGHFKRPAKTLQISVKVKDSIPCLAWLCRMDKDEACFTVGNGVEHGADWVAEGAWDGAFNADGLVRSEQVFGSGAALVDNRMRFIPPKHIFECLYVLADKNSQTTYVSNSLPFVLEASGAGADPGFFSRLKEDLHNAINTASAQGIDRYTQKVFEEGGYTLYRMLYYNFEADWKGHIHIKPNLPRVYFSDFKSYRQFLKNKMASVIQNAAAAERHKTFTPVATLSKGYDSPTVAVLARECGCEEALTMDASVYGLSDSGEDIGRELGYRVYAYQHVISEEEGLSDIPDLNMPFSGGLVEISKEFIATGAMGDDVAYYAFRDKLEGRILLTGSFGDSMWTLNSKVRPGMSCLIPYMKSITEYRLRLGFIFFPVPFMASRFPSAVIRISGMEEMLPFSLGTVYDRPICRRIVEEAGIPRSWFGSWKNATAPKILNRAQLFEEAVREIMQRYA